MARRMGYKTPIMSIKHVIDASGTTSGGSTPTIIPIVLAVRNPVATSPTEVNTGSTVGSIFISVFVLGSTATVSGLVDWYIWKNPGSGFGNNAPDVGNTGINANRRFVFHEEKGLASTEDGTPMVFKGVIRIPPRFRRMGDEDTMELRLLTPTGFDAQFCVKAIFKEYQ